MPEGRLVNKRAKIVAREIKNSYLDIFLSYTAKSYSMTLQNVLYLDIMILIEARRD